MQARGAVLVDSPLATTWGFVTVPYGSIATFVSTIRNAGNAPASITLAGLAQPQIFGLRDAPTIADGGSVASIVGQFVPPWANGTWSDRATLTVRADALCAPLPSTWNAPVITMTGSSSGAP
jgi:hypothetical protein